MTTLANYPHHSKATLVVEIIRGCGQAMADAKKRNVGRWATMHSNLRQIAMEVLLYWRRDEEALIGPALRILLTEGPEDIHRILVGVLGNTLYASEIVEALNKIPADLRKKHTPKLTAAAESFIKDVMPCQRAAAGANKADVKKWLARVRRHYSGFSKWANAQTT